MTVANLLSSPYSKIPCEIFHKLIFPTLSMGNFFPRWSNWLPLKLAIAVVFIAFGVSVGIAYYFTPKYTRVGYEPTQPVPFSHKIHAGQLALDCRYCHSFVETSSHSNVPTNQTCFNCHGPGKGNIRSNSPKLEMAAPPKKKRPRPAITEPQKPSGLLGSILGILKGPKK